MMNHQSRSKQFLLLFTFLFLLACQDDSLNEDIGIVDTQTDIADKDMVAATNMADEYLNSIIGRQDDKKSITVLKFKEGKLYYATNTDDIKGYKEVTEQTITATVRPGEHVFWFSGGGITDLDGIEFDAASQQQLISFPEEINSNKMWVIPISGNVADSDMLKYDIIYQFKENNGPPIRLDPKIKITN